MLSSLASFHLSTSCGVRHQKLTSTAVMPRWLHPPPLGMTSTFAHIQRWTLKTSHDFKILIIWFQQLVSCFYNHWPPCVQYMVLSGVVAMVTCAVFLRLSCVLQVAVLLLATALYTYIIGRYRYEFHPGPAPVFVFKTVENKSVTSLSPSGLISCAETECVSFSWWCLWLPSSSTADRWLLFNDLLAFIAVKLLRNHLIERVRYANSTIPVFSSSLVAGGDGSAGLPVGPSGKERGRGHEGAAGAQWVSAAQHPARTCCPALFGERPQRWGTFHLPHHSYHHHLLIFGASILAFWSLTCCVFGARNDHIWMRWLRTKLSANNI